jgi:hypothetical protein
MPFKPGVSGNPKGRAPGKHNLHSQKIWQEVGEQLNTETGKTKYQELVELVMQQALAGDIRSQELYFERVDGKAAQTLTVVPEAPRPLPALSKEELRENIRLLSEGEGEDEETIDATARDVAETITDGVIPE